MTYDVTLIPGDGIGPEITAETVKVLEATGLRFNWDEELAGMAAVDATGTPLPDATVESIRKNSLALKGPLTTPVGTGFRSVNVGLRKEFELYANVRPARTIIPGGHSRTWTSCWSGRTSKGSTSGWSTSLPSVTIPARSPSPWPS